MRKQQKVSLYNKTMPGIKSHCIKKPKANRNIPSYLDLKKH